MSMPELWDLADRYCLLERRSPIPPLISLIHNIKEFRRDCSQAGSTVQEMGEKIEGWATAQLKIEIAWARDKK